jgi:hypothetical protein
MKIEITSKLVTMSYGDACDEDHGLVLAAPRRVAKLQFRLVATV